MHWARVNLQSELIDKGCFTGFRFFKVLEKLLIIVRIYQEKPVGLYVHIIERIY